jgi:DNA-binding XRE family transcriptional regulator
MLKDRLKELRLKAGYTQNGFAVAVEINYRTYQSYEDGRAEPSIKTMQKLAAFHGVTIDELINGPMERKTEFEKSYYDLSPDKRKIVDYIFQL